MQDLAVVRALYVQPHYDDIALSCGGLAARDAARGDHAVVVTVFSSGPGEAELSQFARELHARWGAGQSPWVARGDEDERAVAVLGATSHRLGHHEAIYRGYGSWPAITATPRAEDDATSAVIAAELAALWRRTAHATVYLPLGIGGHVDHQVCHRTGSALAAAGATVAYYEDFPYATLAGRLERRIAQLAAPITAEIVDVTEWIPRRLEAIGCYTSQLPFLFDAAGRYPGPYEELVRNHARWLGGGGGEQLSECLFRLNHDPRAVG